MGRRYWDILRWIILIAIAFVWLAPLAWVLISSVKPTELLFRLPPVWDFQVQWDNYKHVLYGVPFFDYALNSLKIALLATVICIVVGVQAAYAISRFRPGGAVLPLAILLVRMLPNIVLGVPLFVLFSQFGLVDTLFGVALAHITFTLPLSIWILLGFLGGLPVEYEEAAMVDGCTRWRAIWLIVVPLIRPGLWVAALFVFLYSWNEFFFSLILAVNRVKTLPLGVADFVQSYTILWGPITAATVLITIPPVIFGLIMQRQLVHGLTLGGVKQ